ncbi:hypothetical protein [Mycobacterium malmoense]|uniref:hypothetical protein n=1 Tax=Mycobacterium malmoense TaxID=1780 RepID=UPI0026DA4E05
MLAEVRATAVNQDGRSAGLSAPSGDAQVRLFRRAMTQAGIRPEDVGMVEGHGTGTRLGDRTELRSLARTSASTRRPARSAADLRCNTNIAAPSAHTVPLACAL